MVHGGIHAGERAGGGDKDKKTSERTDGVVWLLKRQLSQMSDHTDMAGLTCKVPREMDKEA